MDYIGLADDIVEFIDELLNSLADIMSAIFGIGQAI
jgi:hypothetical protein